MYKILLLTDKYLSPQHHYSSKDFDKDRISEGLMFRINSEYQDLTEEEKAKYNALVESAFKGKYSIPNIDVSKNDRMSSSLVDKKNH
jgi:hypothetical protein